MIRPLREFAQFISMNTSAKWSPTLRTSESTWAVIRLKAAIIYTHRRHLLLLLSPKANTHFTLPQRVEG